jgi:hypothetical protein
MADRGCGKRSEPLFAVVTAFWWLATDIAPNRQFCRLKNRRRPQVRLRPDS